ncbi:MAG: hypothetical protein IKO75_03715 [Bacteroidales bacterium]|nr:hypothetical protein [Bacteroidales bacterium]
MKEEVSQLELEVPKLRQMVLENTKRIDRNELTINKMRMEATEQTRKISERDESLELSRREHDRRMKSIDERLDRIAQLTEASKIKQEEHENELKETWRLVKENSAQMKESREEFDRGLKESREEFDKRMKESEEKFNRELRESREEFDRRMKETDRQVKDMFAETNASIRRVSVEFLGVTGHIVEGLVSSSAEKVFKDAGFNLHNSGKNLKRELASENRQMELDVMLGNEKIVVPVEVKANFTKKKVKRWLHKMETFRDFFPECADKEVVAAVAAINYEAGAAELAHEEGLLVIRVSSDDIFSLDPVDEEKLRKF